jgi:hypothetical protein
MKTFEPVPTLQPIEPSLALIIDLGMLSRAAAPETPEAALAFRARVGDAISRGGVTRSQAAALRQMLGLRAEPANDHD